MTEISRRFCLLCLAVMLFACSSNNVNSQTTVKCSLSNSKRDLSGFKFGFNMNIAHEPSWKNTQYLDMVKGLHPKILRYPGGTVANYYDWRTGTWNKSLDENKKLKHLIEKPPVNDLKQLKIFLDYTGADLIVDLNMLTSDLNTQLDLLDQMARENIKIKYIELGNEFYLEDEAYKEKFPTNASYYKECQKWIPAIQKKYPDAKIALVGSAVRYADVSRRKEWNQMYTKPSPIVKNVTMHIYGGNGVMNTLDMNVDNILKASFKRVEVFRKNDLKQIPSNVKLWITEFNMFERPGEPVQGTWAHGLYATIMNLLLIEEPRIEMTCLHSLNHGDNGYRAGTVLDNRLPCPGLKKDVEFRYSAPGLGMQLIGKAIEDMEAQEKLTFEGNKDHPGSSKLMGYCYTDNASAKKIILLNLGKQEITVDVAKIAGSSFQYEQIFANPLDKICEPSQVTTISSSGKGMIVLKPYSISLLAL